MLIDIEQLLEGYTSDTCNESTIVASAETHIVIALGKAVNWDSEHSQEFRPSEKIATEGFTATSGGGSTKQRTEPGQPVNFPKHSAEATSFGISFSLVIALRKYLRKPGCGNWMLALQATVTNNQTGHRFLRELSGDERQ